MTTNQPLRQQIDALQQLQDFDTQGDRWRRTLNDYPQLKQALEQELAVFTEKLQSLEKRQQETASALHLQESTLQQQQQRLTRSEERLTQIKTNEEYLAVQKEINTLQGMNTKVGGQITQQREALKNIEHEAASTQRYLVELNSNIDERRQRLEDDLKEATLAQQSFEEKRAVLAQAVSDQTLLKTYDKLRKRMPQVLVKIHQPACEGCKMSLPQQLFNTVLAMQQYQQCPSCFRIFNLQAIPPKAPSKVVSKLVAK